MGVEWSKIVFIAFGYYIFGIFRQLDYLEYVLYVTLHYMWTMYVVASSGASSMELSKDMHILQVAGILFSGHIRSLWLFTYVPWKVGIRQQWVVEIGD